MEEKTSLAELPSREKVNLIILGGAVNGLALILKRVKNSGY